MYIVCITHVFIILREIKVKFNNKQGIIGVMFWGFMLKLGIGAIDRIYATYY